MSGTKVDTKRRGRGHLPLAAALLVLWVTVALLLRLGLERTHGHLVYPLDDAYIHMAIAKHFAREGVWGVTPFAFSSSSSSPLWTALLSLAYWIGGTHESVPLVLNLVFASWGLRVVHLRLRKRLPGLATLLTLVAVIVLTPLPVVALVGMEHSLHILVGTTFTLRAASLLAADPGRPRRPVPLSLLVLAAALPLVRYEGLFAVLVVSALLAARGRRRDGVLLLLVALLPVALYGAYSVGRGWFLVPNSVLVKGVPATLAELLWQVPENLLKARALAALMALGLVLLLGAGRRRWSEDRVLLGVFLGTSLIHLQLASVGWFHRYEAYLMVLGITAVAQRLLAGAQIDAASARGGAPAYGRIAIRLVAAALAAAFAWRRGAVLEKIPLAMQNIYQQQYQMGRFLARAYPGQAVAANDIGTINYLADLRCCDLMGIASMPIARLRLVERRRTADDVDRVVRASGARIAVVYESWFGNQYVTEDRIPPRWGPPVGRWVIRDNVACGGDTVSFFALRPEERDALAARLAAFAPSLPRGVLQAGVRRPEPAR